MEPTDTVLPDIERIHAAAGDVRSNADTITALRQGVGLDHRFAYADVSDHLGVAHTLPIQIIEDAEGRVRVELARDLLTEATVRAVGPRRREGEVEIGDLASFAAYVNAYKGPGSVAFSPAKPPSVTAILDYHAPGAGPARWCRDRVSYRCPFSRQWIFWTKAEAQEFGQVAFGDLIEANADDLTTQDGFATGPEMLAVARNLVIRSLGTFRREVDRTTGTGTLISTEEHGSESTKIPRGFVIAVPIFEGDESLYPIEARLRFTMKDGKVPVFAFVLHNREQALEHALTGLRSYVAKACATIKPDGAEQLFPVYVGTPPAAAR